MDVQGIVGGCVQTAMNLFRSEATLFFQADEQADRVYFEAIEYPVEYNIVDDNGNTATVKGKAFQTDRRHFENLSAACRKDFTDALIVRIENGRREVWKILEEQPFEELILNGLSVRLNTVCIQEKPA